MEIRSVEEVKENVQKFTLEFLRLLESKKNLDEEIKDLKNHWKEQGVPTATVTKALNNIKRTKKKTPSQQHEEDTIEEWLSTNKDIDNHLVALMSK